MRISPSRYDRRFDFSSLSVLIPILITCLSCWICSYFYSIGYPVHGDSSDTPLWNAICRSLPGKEFTYILGLILVIGGAFLLHRANYAVALIREKTLLPFLFYVLFISTNPDFFPLKSTSIGAFCLILAIYQLFISYHDPEARDKAYNAALLIGIGSLLWVHLLWFLPLFWIGMYNFRSLTLRTFLASILGVLTVYWFLFGWCVWMHDFTPFIIPFSKLFSLHFLATDGIVLLNWLSIIMIALFTLVSSLNIITHEVEDSLRSRQFLFFLIMLSVWAFGLYFFYKEVSEEFLEMACIPASILIAHFFTVMRGKIVLGAFWSMVVLLIVVFFVRVWNFL
ncbi:MAG: hypothetical protein IJD84_07235 [Parabacteroides sp.]|nr:hypothetical protein [Parabacteroides sp.]